MTLPISTESVREDCKTALDCVRLAERLRREIEAAGAGSEPAKEIDLALYQTYEMFCCQIHAKWSLPYEATHRKLFFEDHPSLKLVVPPFVEAVKAFRERIVASIPGARRSDWSMVERLKESAVALDRALRPVALPRPEAPDKPIVLGCPDDEPIVNGKRKGRLTPGQYRVVKALLDAHPERLSMDTLVVRSKTDHPIGMIDRLRRDPDWAAVLDKARQPHGGYGIRNGRT